MAFNNMEVVPPITSSLKAVDVVEADPSQVSAVLQGEQGSADSIVSIPNSGLASVRDSLETIRHRKSLSAVAEKTVTSVTWDEENLPSLESLDFTEPKPDQNTQRASIGSAKKVHIDNLPTIITDTLHETTTSDADSLVCEEATSSGTVENQADEIAVSSTIEKVPALTVELDTLFGSRPSPMGRLSTASASPSLLSYIPSRLCLSDLGLPTQRGMLKGVDAVHVGTVLQDCADQLAVLGSIMPTTFESRSDAAQIVSDDIAQLVEGQLNIEKKYEQLMTKKDGKSQLGNKSMASDLKNSTYLFSRSLKQSPLTPDNLSKVQEDRSFLEQIIVSCMSEVKDSGGYQTLIDAVKAEKEKKAKLQQTILKEQEGQKRIKSLQNQLKDVKKDKESEIQQRNEMIAHLKDQLQEVKAKTNMEGKYVKKVSEVSVAMTQKKCYQSEKDMRENIDSLRLQIDEETRVNAEIESYLRTHQTELETKVEFWMEKYDKDVEAKQHELDVLKASKAKDLERLQELTKLYAEYEQIVVEDRIEREKVRRRAEQEAIELNACISLQSWWRGVMVRKGLGPYSKKKKKKGKKGKKSGKKKKK